MEKNKNFYANLVSLLKLEYAGDIVYDSNYYEDYFNYPLIRNGRIIICIFYSDRFYIALDNIDNKVIFETVEGFNEKCKTSNYDPLQFFETYYVSIIFKN